ncbi:Uncharacterized protein QTN25_006658 [Entamoeba marina]
MNNSDKPQPIEKRKEFLELYRRDKHAILEAIIQSIRELQPNILPEILILIREGSDGYEYDSDILKGNLVIDLRCLHVETIFFYMGIHFSC